MKNLKTVASALAVILLPLLQACAHGDLDKKIDDKVAQESGITTRKKLNAEASKLVEGAPGLSVDQRTKLDALRIDTAQQVDNLYTESLKLRSVLVKDLISVNYNEDEVELIKKRIKNLEDKRLSVTFDAIEKANTILGHEAMQNTHVVDELFEGHANRD